MLFPRGVTATTPSKIAASRTGGWRSFAGRAEKRGRCCLREGYRLQAAGNRLQAKGA
jgi:hypothetical protein